MNFDGRQKEGCGCSRCCCQLAKSCCLILLLILGLSSQPAYAADFPLPREGPDIGHDEDV